MIVSGVKRCDGARASLGERGEGQASRRALLVCGLMVCALSVAAQGCAEDGGAAGEGSLAFTVSGEERAVEGFPSRAERKTPFADGWSLQFTKVLVSVGDVTIATTGGATRSDANTYVIDLSKGDADLLTFADVEAQRWDRVSWALKAPGDGAQALGGVSAEDIAQLRSAGANYLIEGNATRDDLTYTFSWLISNPTQNTDCTNGEDQTAGVVVPVNVTAQAQMTIHLDHLFWDRLGAESTTLRFDAIAAAAGDDKHITWDELESQRLSDLIGIDGQPLRDEAGALLTYDPGSVALSDLNLKAFMATSSATSAHLNGSGLCTIKRAP
jgi:hypothetical protein